MVHATDISVGLFCSLSFSPRIACMCVCVWTSICAQRARDSIAWILYIFIIVIMIPVWFDSDSVCFFLPFIHTQYIHIYSKRPLFRCVLSHSMHVDCCCCFYVCIGNSEYNVFVFDLVNCWLHAKQHRMLYGPRIRNFPIFNSTIHSYGIYCFVCVFIRSSKQKRILCDWFFWSGHAWQFEFIQ